MDLKRTVQKFDVTKSKNIVTMGRLGYAARAVVYGLVGIFALLLTFHRSGALSDSKGVLQRLIDLPFGKIILGGIAAGLLFFAIWRILQAIRDYEHKGTDAKGLAVRVGYGFSGLTYVTLAFFTVNLIFHLTRQSKGGGEKELAATILGQSFGPFLLGAVALLIVGIGVGQIVIAFREKFKEGLDIPRSRAWIASICKIGITARGIVFVLTGWFFLQAAIHANSNEAEGMMGVWSFLGGLPFGTVLVTAMAAGLLAFSVYGFTEAAYRDLRVSR